MVVAFSIINLPLTFLTVHTFLNLATVPEGLLDVLVCLLSYDYAAQMSSIFS
jgi:hypothetical protein